MQLIMGGINGEYLTNITLNAAAETQEVLAAVAYATDMDLLFDWCWNNGIPLKYFGRLDEGLPVKPSILSAFLARKSARFQCRLVQQSVTGNAINTHFPRQGISFAHFREDAVQCFGGSCQGSDPVLTSCGVAKGAIAKAARELVAHVIS